MGELTFEIWGLGGAALVALLLEILKRLWTDADGNSVIKDRWAVVAAIVLGVLLSTLVHLQNQYPTLLAWAKTILAGVVAGSSACGIFSLTKSRPK